MIMEKRGELKEENRPLWSLALLSRIKVLKANWEVKELTLECDTLVEDLDTLRERKKLL